jgi:DNA-binding beta-propeller fold protein YncE
MTFSPDGTTAYVSGEPIGNSMPVGPTVGNTGDVIHVFSIDTTTGHAVENTPITLPTTTGGSARSQSFPPSTTTLPSFPVGIAITPDAKTLVVALYNADKAAIIDIASGSASTVSVGAYPFGAAIERSGRYAFISNAFDGTLSKIDLTANTTTTQPTTISGIGGPAGDANSQPQFILADPNRDQIYVAVTNQDGVAIVSTTSNAVTKFISLKLPAGYGSQPVSLALTPDGQTLYVADTGENAIVEVALADRADGSAKAYDIIGKIPTADYTSDVALTPDGCTMIWAAARGFGAGPNPQYGGAPPPRVNNNQYAGPYPTYTLDMLVGRVGILPTPTDATFAQMTTVVNTAQLPENGEVAPANTPVVAADGGPSQQIKYVFYVVKENRSYDQIFGSDPRGDGDPSLEVLGDNGETVGPKGNAGTAGPGSGVTPNQHALSRMFVLLDRFFEDSEVSVDGHAITTGAYASNYTLKTMHADYSNRGRPANQEGVYPVSFSPNDFLFDQAVRQNISFQNYGELAGGAAPGISDDGRSTYAEVIAHSNNVAYADNVFIGCVENPSSGAQYIIPNSPDCAFDAGMGTTPPLALSRIDVFNTMFQAQLLANAVPSFNYLIMPSDHTNGTGAGARDPLAMCADNDLGLGQLVQVISASKIWPQSVIFVVEDDSQDGADHVDAHRAPAQVIGPWVKHGGSVVHTHYDQLSVIRTIELILGMQPLSVFDAVATPMYDVFTTTPDNTPYTAIMPTQNIQAVNPATAANAVLSAQLPWGREDAVPQAISDRILWQRVYGIHSTPPLPGPNASRREHLRAVEMMAALRSGKNLREGSAAKPDDD